MGVVGSHVALRLGRDLIEFVELNCLERQAEEGESPVNVKQALGFVRVPE